MCLLILAVTLSDAPGNEGGASPPASSALGKSCADSVTAQVTIDRGHPWRPPFGTNRVGASPVAHVELATNSTHEQAFFLAEYQGGQEIRRQRLSLRLNPTFPPPKKPSGSLPSYASVSLATATEEVALQATCVHNHSTREVARTVVYWPDIEAAAEVRPNQQINPVDLGVILVPHDWLLVGTGQKAVVTVAALAHRHAVPNARLRIWFNPAQHAEVSMPLDAGKRSEKTVELTPPSGMNTATLRAALMDGARELWKKEIRVLLVPQAPHWPNFGAVETKLRYDAPIATHDANTGAPSSPIAYDTAWDPQLKDVVVFLPNGARFVFWRGSSYVPFWAGQYNTGVSYQWAENLSIRVHHPDGITDLPEPLFDRELRYGKVDIIESTQSRIHVRWTYQLTDVHYNIWGDHATEDYYFYPDGFGTRVLTLASTPDTPYQLTEFIVLSPQAAFPFDILPNHMADAIFLDGQKTQINFPVEQDAATSAGRPVELVANPQKRPIIYRFFAHKKDTAAAIYFTPRDSGVPAAYWPFYDRGQMVTPTYWGSHWPLSRGQWTHWSIDDGIYAGPAHNSIAGWSSMPEPLMRSEYPVLDALGVAKTMTTRRWAALIAKTDAPDDALLNWAKSYSNPPSLELSGANIDFPSYSPERRALRLVVDSTSVDITLKTSTVTVNPVFELEQAPKRLSSVTLNEAPISVGDYAWDGKTLWIRATIEASGARISLRFR